MQQTRYTQRRDFQRTPEPRGDGDLGKRNAFVIQKHDASTLHYDLRLRVGDVLKSWAVPKGPSLDPRQKRLAIRTEDHPIGYLEFEGRIPEGEYGAGIVLIWDRGTYDNATVADGETKDPEKAIEDGHFVFRLHGEKLAGGFALQRIERGEDENWLLVKMDDAAADARRNPVSTQPDSVKSGRSLQQIAKKDE